MNKLKQFGNKVIDFLDDFLAYLLTIIGILSSTYIPMLKEKGSINLDIDWGRFILAAVVALLVIGKQERLIGDSEGNTIKAREGRRKNFLLRMANALGQGMLWSQLSSLPK
jgi:hypothetical protein